jgi:hypothetical protein
LRGKISTLKMIFELRGRYKMLKSGFLCERKNINIEKWIFDLRGRISTLKSGFLKLEDQ